MAASELGILGFGRVVEIFDAAVDRRVIPANLVFRNRVAKVPALDGEIVAQFLGEAHIADFVEPDQKASTYKAARIKFQQDFIPKIKLGRSMTEVDILQYQQLQGALAGRQSQMAVDYFTRIAAGLLESIELREESLLVGLELDTFTYSRNGVIYSFTWGMPTDLKLTAAVAWSTSATAKPISDILNLAYVRRVKYGKVTDRVKLTTPAFQLLTATAEFQAKAAALFASNVPPPAFPYVGIDQLQNIVGTLLGMTVELYDSRYPSHPADGTLPTYAPFLPLNNVILDSKANDNNGMAKDLANGILPETVVADIPLGAEAGPGSVFGLGGADYGPKAFATRSPDLNPPTITWWAAERCMPRKRDIALTAVIDIGTVTDPVSASTITF
jgi:hypothetical protein